MREVPGTPSIGWSAAIAGGALTIAVSLVLGVGAPSVIAALVGGGLAARLAGHHGALQGAAAAAVFIVVIGILESVSPLAPLPADTVQLIVVDTAHLVAGAVGGWVALRR